MSKRYVLVEIDTGEGEPADVARAVRTTLANEDRIAIRAADVTDLSHDPLGNVALAIGRLS
jgi:hypothetical protein